MCGAADDDAPEGAGAFFLTCGFKHDDCCSFLRRHASKSVSSRVRVTAGGTKGSAYVFSHATRTQGSFSTCLRNRLMASTVAVLGRTARSNANRWPSFCQMMTVVSPRAVALTNTSRG